MRHRRPPVYLAVTLAASMAVMGMSAGTANADTNPTLPSGVSSSGTTLARVFGTVDPAWLGDETTAPEVTAPDGSEVDVSEVDAPDYQGTTPQVPPNGIVLTPEMVLEYAGQVYGVVKNAEGAAVAGADVVLSLIPQPGTGDADVLAQTVTGAAGEFLLKVPNTEEVLAAAAEGNGTVNMWLDVVEAHATGVASRAYYGGGGIYTAMMEFGHGTGIATAPVNVGVLIVSSALSQYAGASIPETPSDDPEDPNTMADPTPGVLTLGTGEAVSVAPTAPEPYVWTPSTGAILNVPATPNIFNHIDPSPPEGEEDTSSPGPERCKYPKNQGTWMLDHELIEVNWQPVGEVHGWLGMKVQYIYAEHANTKIGTAIKPEGKSWSVSGGVSITNNGSAQNETGWAHDYTAVPAEAEFVQVYRHETWCPESYNPDRHTGPLLTRERIYTTKWTGGLRLGSRQLGGDGWEEYKKAAAKGRAMTMYPGNRFTKSSGKSYKYTFAVSAFGVGLNAESVHDVKHKAVIVTSDRLKDYHAWGNANVPASADNKAVYVSG